MSKSTSLKRLVNQVDYLKYRIRWEKANASAKIDELKRIKKQLEGRLHSANRMIDRAQKTLRELHNV
jgi:uncharacterized protein YhaN